MLHDQHGATAAAHVVDELVVAPSPGNLKDHEISHLLTQALERRMPDVVPTIQVAVKQGVVTLRGSVPNAALSRAAQDAAEHTAGAVGVQNLLKFPRPA